MTRATRRIAARSAFSRSVMLAPYNECQARKLDARRTENPRPFVQFRAPLAPFLAALATFGTFVFPAVAGAVPIRDLAASSSGNYAYVSATVYSPPRADGCGASYLVGVFADAPGTPRYALRRGRLNVCRDLDRASGWSRGEFALTFNASRWPIQKYVVCVSATQTVGGLPSTHRACIIRKL